MAATKYTTRATRIPGLDTNVRLACRYDSGISKFTAETSSNNHSMWEGLQGIMGTGDSEVEAVKNWLTKAVANLRK